MDFKGTTVPKAQHLAMGAIYHMHERNPPKDQNGLQQDADLTLDIVFKQPLLM